MEFLIEFFSNYGYFAVFFVLLICGFGVPIPEDITLVSGGIIAGLGFANPHIMLVVSLFGVLVGDSVMYWLGRIFGVRILRFRLIKPMIRKGRLRKVRNLFSKYGNRLLFAGRFLPGLRAAVFLLAGVTKRVKYWQFIAVDFMAAIISVPIWVYLGNYGASNIDWIKEQISKGQMILWIILAVVIAFVAIKILITYYAKKKEQEIIKK